jgi:WD40 repeat protein
MKPSLPILTLLLLSPVSFAWDLKPDPPAEKVWAAKPGLAVPVTAGEDIAFADAHGPFVLTGLGKTTSREVYDLRTGTSVAKLTVDQAKQFTDRELLSPNGQVWAFGKSMSQEVKLFSAATGQWLPAVKTDAPILNVGFAPDGRLAVVTTANKQRTVRLFDTATGKEQRNWEIDGSGFYLPGTATRLFAFSPGGKYLVASGWKAVSVYTTADGKKAAELELPTAEPGSRPMVLGVAFSADGTELAAVVGKSAKGTGVLKVWKLSDGTAAEHVVNRPATLPGQFAPAVAPVLSGGWLIDGTQVWADGQVKAVPESPGVPLTRLALSPAQLLGIVEPPLLDRGTKKPTVGVLGGSGTASSVAKDGSLVGAVEMPTDERAGWTGAVAGFIPPFNPTPHKLTMPKGVVGLTVSLDGKRCFVESDFGPRADTARRAVLSVDAQSGAVKQFDLPEKCVLFGDAMTGEAFLTVGAADAAGNGERLELFTAEGKSVVAWRPHPEIKSPDPARSSIRYAAALSTSRAITVGNGRVTLWQLPEAKTVWTAKMPEALGGGLSPDGKVLFVPHAGGVRALNVDSGGTFGNLSGGTGVGRAGVSVRVSGDGRQLAAFDASAGSRVARVWDLTTGKLSHTFEPGLLSDTPPLRWLGTRFLLFAEQVFDTTDGRVMWKLKPPATGALANSAPADWRLWFVSGMAGTATLHPAAFPEDQLGRFLTDYAKTGDDGIFQTGEKVKVVIDAAAAPPGWDAKARTSARLALTRAGLTEDAKATTVVTVTYTTAPDTPVKLKWQGVENLGREETINRFAVEARTVVTRDGQTVHTAPPARTQMQIKDWPQVNEITDDSKSGQEFFTRQVWQSASFSAGSVFATSGVGIPQPNGVLWRLPGEATLTADGLNMNWPAGATPAGATGGGGGVALPSPPPAATPAAAGASTWIVMVVGGVCGGLVVAVGVVVLVLVMRGKAKKKLDDDDDRPRKRTRPDDDDDRPRRKRRPDDDEDDDRPRRKRTRDDDDDDDDRPRRRRRD